MSSRNIKNHFRIIFILPLVFMAMMLSAQSEGNWDRKEDFLDRGRFGSVAFTIGDKGYIGLGTSADQNYMSDLWEYDPTNDTWTQMADMPGPVRQLGIGFSIEGKGYVGLGRNTEELLNDIWEYDPVNNSWMEVDSFPGIGVVSATAFTINDIAYVGTGNETNVVGSETNTFWQFDPANGWIQKADFPGEARDRAASFTIGNFAYLGTGFNAFSSTMALQDFWEYNPANDTWTQKGDYGGPARSGAAAFTLSGQGYLGLGFPLLRDLWRYDPSTDTWQEDARFPISGRFNPAVFTIGNKAYLYSGFSNQGGVNNYFVDFWEFNPTPVSTKEVLEKVEIQLLPNPSSEKIIIEITGAEFVEVSVTDLKGNEILKTNKIEFSIGHLPKGNYVALIKTTKGINSSIFSKM